MEIKINIIELDRMKTSDYYKPIGFTVVLIFMAFIMNSMEYGQIENYLSLIGIIALIILIPLNQIFRIRRIHIYKVNLSDKLEIYYQDILREKLVKIPIRDAVFEHLKTSIIGCSKLRTTYGDIVLNQYCNQYWTNEVIEDICRRLSELKSQNSVV